MTVPLKRVPPPPPIAKNDPVFNRWLHDLTAFIAEGGGVDPGVIPGYDVLVSTVALHTTQISSLTISVASNTSQIGVNTSHIATNTAAIATNAANITTNASHIATNTTNIATNTTDITALTARSQVWNGITAPAAGFGADGDWYSDITAKHVYIKTGGSWVLIV